MFHNMFKNPFQRLQLTAGAEGGGDEGGGGGGTKEPTIAEMQARMQALEADNAKMAKEREQLLQMAANVDKVVLDREKQRKAGRKVIEEDVNLEDDESQVDEPVRKVMTKRVGGLRAELQGSIAQMQDQLDAMQFMNLANTMGIDGKTIGEVETQYRGMRDSGMAIVDSSGNRKPLTRMDALDLHFGRAARAKQMKEAPEQQYGALRERILGGGGMENAGGGGGGYRRPVKGFDTKKFEGLATNKERVDAMEKVLSDVPLVWAEE